eukprot:GGOE01037205.1.p1 GENE.GGOE01037205.1~~GGOE01037205.1.p1  ORF type:complete len:598 (-),score=180.35 GGOE01037205.1:243-1967(-)
MPKESVRRSRDIAGAQKTLFLAGCPESTSRQHIEAHYATLGPHAIESVRWGNHKDGSFAGFMHVQFANAMLAKEALTMPPPVVFGRKLHVKPVQDTTAEKKLSKGKSVSKKTEPSAPKEEDAGKKKMRVVVRDFHERLRLSKRSAVEVQRFREGHQMQVASSSCPNPVIEWNEVAFGEAADKVLHTKFGRPTPCQSQTWPVLLSGHNCISLAKTGSGKTLAYLLPGMVHAAAQVGSEPRMLVLAPTRELVMQIAAEAEQYALAFKLRLGLAFGGLDGGGDQMMQSRVLRRGVDVLIGTPGRLVKFVEAEVVNVGDVSFLVVDEADEMLSNGFEEKIKDLLAQTHSDRQVSLFSATWPPTVEEFANSIASEPVRIVVDRADVLTANQDVVQEVVVFSDDKERDTLCMKAVKRIKEENKQCSRTLVFVNAKVRVESLVDELSVLWQDIYALHGDYQQSDREASLRALRKDPHAILVATDVAARGLDICDLAAVVNYNMPTSLDKYIHRIGRTGRAGKKGLAITLFHAKHDHHLAAGLKRLMREAGQKPPKELRALPKEIPKDEPPADPPANWEEDW